MLADLDQASANCFEHRCRYVWDLRGERLAFIFSSQDFFLQGGVGLSLIIELQALGLIYTVSGATFSIRGLPKSFTASYHNQSIEFTMAGESKGQLEIGDVMFTPAGIQLMTAFAVQPISGYLDHMIDRWLIDSRIESVRCGE